MAFEFVARNGIIGLANSTISGSLAVSQSVTAQSFTGSLSGSALAATSASYALSSSFATTASYATNAANAFIQNGNSFGAQANIGTNDNQNLNIETNGTSRILVYNDGNIRVQSTASMKPFMDGMYIDNHPEGDNPAIIPYLGNDIAYLTLRGGTFTGTPGPGSTVVTSATLAEAMFDGAPTYAGFTSTDLSGSYTASIAFPQSYTYGNTIGFSFGNTTWRAKDFKVEILVTGSYYTLDTVTNYSYANYNKTFSYGTSAVQGARITFSNFNYNPGFRIADIFLLNYSSQYGKGIYVGRDGGSIFKSIAVTGSVIASTGFTGSLFGTASYASQSLTASNANTASYVLNAVSASYAQTASYANNFTVGGTLTAQTIVAQTITSSIEFITGSTRNGSLLTNTHQFTGSLFQTGSTAIFMGNVGIGTTSPTGSNTSNLLHVAGNSAVLRVGPYYSVGGDRDFVEIIASGADTKVTSTNERFYLENTAGSIIISATNNIGIGTTVPSASLHISGTTGGVFEVDGAAAVNALYVSASGNIGIGTTTPISYTAGATVLNILSSGVNSEIKLTNSTTGNAAGAGLLVGQYGVNTVITNASTGYLLFGTSDAERMRITSAGNVGIGTTSPSYKLDINGSFRVSGSNGEFIVANTGNDIYLTRNGASYFIANQASSVISYLMGTGASQSLFLANNGNVLIGTTSDAGYKLDVNGTGRFTGNLYAGTSGSSDRGLYVGSSGNEASFLYNATTGNLDISPRSGYSTLIKSATTFGTSGGTGIYNVYANLYVGKGLQVQGNYASVASIPDTGVYGTDSTFADGYGSLILASRIDAARPILFGTYNGTAFAERMRITSAGNVGIGTSSPYQKLVNAGYIALTTATAGTDATADVQRAGIGWHSTNSSEVLGSFITAVNQGAWGSDIQFFTRLSTGGNSSEKMRITNTGNVGIGTTTPNSTLSISGSASITGSVTSTVGFTGSLSGSASSATSASYALTSTTAATATSAGTVTGTSGQLIKKDDRIIEPNSITSGYAQFGFTSWNNNNASPYADYLHLRSYTDGSGGNDNLVVFNKSTIGMRIFQQSWNSASAYSDYRDVALVSGSATGYIPLYQSATVLTGSSIYQSGLNIGIGTTIPNSLFTVNGNTSITGSLVVSTDITGSNIRATTNINAGNTITSPNISWSGTQSSNGGEIRISQTQFRAGNNITFLWSQTTDSNGTKDLGLRRNTTGSLEIYDGITADGAIANRRDLLARNITGSNALISGSLTISGSANISGSISLNGSVLSAVSGFQQTFSAATTWTVTHNLNTSYPVITVYDSSNRVVLPASITATSANVVTITFNVATAGSVNILSGQLQQNMVLSNPSAVAISTVLGG